MNSKPRLPGGVWLFVGIAFLLLITAWTALIIIAQRHKPAEIPLPPPAGQSHR